MADHERGEGNTRNYLNDEISSAYDMDGGMGVHLHAVQLLCADADLPDWARKSLTGYGSNYLYGMYITVWEDPETYGEILKESAPKHFSPHSNSHLKLLKATREAYQRIGNQKIRYLLGGEEGLDLTNDPSEPIEPEKVETYFQRAQKREIIGIPKNFDLSTLSEAINRGEINFYLALEESDIQIKPKFFEENEKLHKIKPDERFYEETKKAAIYKLGAMLAVTEQVFSDAAQQGQPIPYDFQPQDPKGTWHKNWQKLFNEEMPTIGKLYQQARSVFLAVADRNDPVLSYLFPLDTLAN